MQTILHLTDVHFGWEGDSLSELAERKVCLDGLVAELKKLEGPWKPTIVCLTGDVGWSGDQSDYISAKMWLDEVMAACCLGYDSLIVCPGNHDVVRTTAKKLPRPDSATEADEVLAAPVATHFEKPFESFVSFCRAAAIPPLEFGDTRSYLVGARHINDIRFIVLNSAWFSKDDHDQGKLWIGLPHIKFMEANEQIVIAPDQAERFTVALIHHPQNWLHESESQSIQTRPNTMDYLANRCHLILTGHTHGEVRGANRLVDQALHFAGGSAYAGASHFNSFRLIQISPDTVTDRAFEFDPISAANKWRSTTANSRPIAHREHTDISATTSQNKVLNTDELRLRSRKEAVSFLALKSRLLKRSGQLPPVVARPVSVRVSDQHDSFDDVGRLVRLKDAEHLMPIHEAVRQSRRTLLFGDLGTGKSTLAAQLVIATLDGSSCAVAVLIPVKVLSLVGRFNRRDLFDAINKYIRDEVLLMSLPLTIEQMLERNIELCLVFDGLDELATDIAARLLSAASAIVENWPTVQVISTARPVELVGTSYDGWRVIHTVPLDDEAKIEFLKNELIAANTPEDQVDERAVQLLKLVKDNPALNIIANSPLAIRLIYPRLSSFSKNSELTLGDLLYDVVMERLSGWHKRDDKPDAYKHLNELLPTAEAKAEYLAILARAFSGEGRLGRDAAKSLLYEAGSELVGANQHLLAQEALSYFEWLGLITVSETVDFPLQPLVEVCSAAGLVAKWHSTRTPIKLENRTQWRIVSFAAAIARRRGFISEFRTSLLSIIEFLLVEPGFVPAVCFIVAESLNVSLAKEAIRRIDNVEYRPLRYFWDERRASARNIAKTLALAGDIGFDWFFADYLDPRYPTPNAGSAVVVEVFPEWAALIRTSLTSGQIERLTTMVEPYRATGDGFFHGLLKILCVLVPIAFEARERIQLLSAAMDHPLFTDWAEQQLKLLWSDTALEPIVDHVVQARCGESVPTAKLWLEKNKNKQPPPGIIRLAIRSVTQDRHLPGAAYVISQCLDRLGEKKWVRFARWFLILGESSLGCAKLLFDRGERSLSILGDSVMSAMHDGGYVAEAETILGELIRSQGEDGVRWLAYRIAHADEMFGGHSGWWRKLLPLIDGIAEGPRLLAICVRNLGPFTLPRYPEVRESFTRLLVGSRGAEFRTMLRNQLKSLDPKCRRGAALVLITSDPSGEAEALFVAVRSRARPNNYDWSEWESFLLTLNFGPSVLAALKGKLEFLEERSRALALVILAKGKFELEQSQRDELMVTLSLLENWRLSRDPALQAIRDSLTSFESLRENLRQPNLKQARRAADQLLKAFGERLTALEKAKCVALRESELTVTWDLEENLKRIAQEPNFARDVIVSCAEIAADGGSTPVLGIIALAITQKTRWNDVLWALFCDDTRYGGVSELEGAGMALLTFGLEWEEYRNAIGEAARGCLEDPRFKQNRWHEAFHWVALLADEFCGLCEGKIREVIVHGKPIGYSATTALIARLGSIPEGFSNERIKRNIEEQLSEAVARKPETVLEALREFGRNSEELHPDLIGTLEEAISLEINEAGIVTIARSGKPGILIAVVVRFIYGQPLLLSDTIPLLDISARAWLDDQQKSHIKPLTRVWKWLRESLILGDKATRETYLKALDHEIDEGVVWKLAVAEDILEMRGALLTGQIPIIFSEYAEHVSFLHDSLYGYMCLWISKEQTPEVQKTLVLAARQAIVKLNEAPWRAEVEGASNHWGNLLFPAIIWANGILDCELAEAVFLRGLRGVFNLIPGPNGRRQTNLVQMLERLDPILSKAPAKCISSMIRLGIESDEPSVRVFCQLATSVSKYVGKVG